MTVARPVCPPGLILAPGAFAAGHCNKTCLDSTWNRPTVRLRVDEFYALDIVHLESAIDIESCGRPGASDLCFGTTEWAGRCADRENASFRWDWLYDRQARRIEAQWSTLRSGVQLYDESGVDLGEQGLRLCLALHMTRVRWEWVVAGALGLALAVPRPDA